MRANLGCGGQIVNGWVNIDRTHPEITLSDPRAEWLKCDLAADRLPFNDDTLDYAVCHHVLGMLDIAGIEHVLREARRVIRPGGALRISDADTWAAIEAWESEEWEWFDEPSPGVPKVTGDPLTDFLWLGGARRTFLTRVRMARLLITAEFTPYQMSYHNSMLNADICALDAREGESFYIEGVVPI